jgi:hypothetical protein
MIWWFLILGVSTLVVVCVAIALYMRLRRRLTFLQPSPETSLNKEDPGHHSSTIEQ